jgi:hypothetical protein
VLLLLLLLPLFAGAEVRPPAAPLEDDPLPPRPPRREPPEDIPALRSVIYSQLTIL